VAGIEKGEQAFRTITEAAELLDVPAHVLRFWEGKFPQLRPLKRAGGRRHYRPEDMALLRGIRALLQEDGYQLKGVQKVLKDQGVAFVRARGAGPQPDVLPPVTSDPEVLALGAAARGPVYPLSPQSPPKASAPSGPAIEPPKAAPSPQGADQDRLLAALEKLERADAILSAVAAFQRRTY
jgi:DNA-binding transcriptional MerR regulator